MFELEPKEVLGKTRKAKPRMCRQAISAVAYETLKITDEKIGKLIGFDRLTIRHSRKVVLNTLENRSHYADFCNYLYNISIKYPELKLPNSGSNDFLKIIKRNEELIKLAELVLKYKSLEYNEVKSQIEKLS